MKEGWTYRKLGEVCESFNGLWKGKKPPFVNVGVIRNANFTKDFTLSFDNIEYLDVEEKQYSKRKLQYGDLIVEKSGGSEKQPVGRAVLFDKNDGEFSFSNFTSVLRIKDQSELTSAFLYKYLLYVYQSGATKRMQKATTGIHNLEYQQYLNIDIPCIGLPEQKRIVERLDAAFAHIDELKANAEKQLTEARALFHNCLTKAMEPKEGWEEKTIGELTDSCLGKMLDKQKNKGEYQPYLRNINVRWGGFDLSDILEMKFEDDEDERYGIKTGDLIICEGGEPGRCAIWEGQIENMKIQKALHRVRCRKDLLNSYLYYSIMFYAQNGVLEKYESGATIKHLTGEALRKIPLSYPSLSEQQRIVARLDSLSENVRKYEEIQRKVISECDALKQALLRKVFE